MAIRQTDATAVFDGTVHAPEFPEGLDWLNTASPLKLSDLRGKFVLLDFWTFCCINCMHILPDLRGLETKYSQELVVIGVHAAKFEHEKDTAEIRKAILRYGVRHPVVNDSGFHVWRLYAAHAWPTLVLINPVGKIIGQYSGEGVYEPFDALLSQAIPYFEARGQLQRSALNFVTEEEKRANTLLNFPGKVSSDEASGRLFVTDSGHHRILVVNPDGKILDVVGSGEEGAGDGSFENSTFQHPQGTFLSGDVLYIADTENHLIRAAGLKNRTVTTPLGTGLQARGPAYPGKGTSVDLNSPWDLLVHERNLYIAMAGAHQLWVADLNTWDARAYAGTGAEQIYDGRLREAVLAQPSGIATDGHKLYFADSETSSIREAGFGDGARVETIVGKGLFEFGDMDGDAATARLQHPLGIAVRDGWIYVADSYNNRIKLIDPIKRNVTTLAGSGRKELTDGLLREAAFNEPGGLAWLGGKLYVADTNNHQIRVLDLATRSVATLVLRDRR